jgi:hypothetical protein
MYCDRCGTSLSPTSRFCSSCGKQVVEGAAASYSGPQGGPVGADGGLQVEPAPGEDRVRRNIHRLATLWLVNGVLRLLLVLWLYGAGRVYPFPNFGPMRMWMFPFWQSAAWDSILLILGLFGVAHLLLAWGLYERQPWARYLGLVLGFFALVRVPFGTALGIYTIWVLLPASSSREYERLAHAA